MLFSSLEFLYLFLPITLLLYFLAPARWRNPLLFAVSLVFYGWGEPRYIALMLFTIAVDYLSGLWMARLATRRGRRVLLAVTVLINLGLLAFFKYSGFIADNLRRLPVLKSLPVLTVALPLGISFYTFQALSYVVDVYRGDVSAQRNPIAFGTYVTLFPQLVAGPIVRYSDVAKELTSRKSTLIDVAGGIRTFAAGLCKKVFLANGAGALWATLRDTPSDRLTTLGALFGIVAFTFQIYFDFSGYSDMAIGLGRMLGFRFPENFDYPLCAHSVTDFWRRWHITLSTWFREYVYIPLGGNRRGLGRTYLNLLVVWVLTGLWHGASWNFVLWGLYFFLLLSLEKWFLGRLFSRLPRAFGHAWTLLCVLFGFYIFVFDATLPSLSPDAALAYLQALVGRTPAGFAGAATRYEVWRHLPLLLLCTLGATPYPRRLYWRLYEKYPLIPRITPVLCVAGLLLATAYLVDGSYNPFLYFRF